MLVAALGFVILAACFMGPAMTAAMEHFSTDVRFSGFALGYNAGAPFWGRDSPGGELADSLNRLADRAELLSHDGFGHSPCDVLPIEGNA